MSETNVEKVAREKALDFCEKQGLREQFIGENLRRAMLAAIDDAWKCKQEVIASQSERLRKLSSKHADALAILRSIVADVDAMQCKTPSWLEILLLEEGGPTEDWFGAFEEGTFDSDFHGYLIRWPNLSILLERAKEVVG